MRTKIMTLGLICLFLTACEKAIENPYSPAIIQPPDGTEEGEHNPSKTAIEIVGEPEILYTCYDYESSFETFDFSLTIKNVSDKLIIGCVLKLVIYGEEPQGVWDYLAFYHWDMISGANLLPSNILPDEERIVTTATYYPIPIGTAGGIDMCERMRAGNAEFRFEAYF